MGKYELNILQDNKPFINYNGSIGSFENEIYTICFKNNSCNTIQINILINGINILSGTEGLGKRWAINPYDKLKLSAWQETAKGGAEFRFTKEDIIKANIYESNGVAGETNAAWILTDKSNINYNNYEANKIMETRPYYLSKTFIEQPVMESRYSLEYKLSTSIEIKCENWTALQAKMRGTMKIAFRRFNAF